MKIMETPQTNPWYLYIRQQVFDLPLQADISPKSACGGRRRIKILITGIIIFFTLLYVNHSFAQQTDTDKERRLQQEETLSKLEKNQELKETEETSKTTEKVLFFRAGGSAYTVFHKYQDLDNNDGIEEWVKKDFSNDLRLWFKFFYQNSLSGYFRIKNKYIQRWVSYDYVGDGDDYFGPDMDMAYLTFYGLKQKNLTFTLGRQSFNIGRGITYSDTHDGLKLSLKSSKIYCNLLLSRTKPHDENIDYSAPGYDKYTERRFWGGEIGCLLDPHHAVYFYNLFQRDFSEEKPIDAAQDYNYNSYYLGLGINGKLTYNLKYWAEYILERGESHTDKDSSLGVVESDIDAWALDIGARYYFDNPFRPSLELEFAHGSGDKDRSSVTNTNGGNLLGKDKNFLYFGAFYSGYALSTQLSNINIYKLDIYFLPLAKITSSQDKLTLGAKYYYYRKDKASGGTYDTDATQAFKDIGQEANLYIYFNPNKNLSYKLRYGVFFPGKAYADNTNDKSTYLLIQQTLSF